MELIKKDWLDHPIEVGSMWRKQFAGSTQTQWVTGRDSLEAVVKSLKGSGKILSIGVYETRVVDRAESGIYFDGFMPTLDAEDHDITRNLETLWVAS